MAHSPQRGESSVIAGKSVVELALEVLENYSLATSKRAALPPAFPKASSP